MVLKITVSATSADAFRGRTLNLLIADELAFVRKGIARRFFGLPIILLYQTSTEAKIIIISTPNGMFNLFHKLYGRKNNEAHEFFTFKLCYGDKKMSVEAIQILEKQTSEKKTIYNELCQPYGNGRNYC